VEKNGNKGEKNKSEVILIKRKIVKINENEWKVYEE